MLTLSLQIFLWLAWMGWLWECYDMVQAYRVEKVYAILKRKGLVLPEEGYYAWELLGTSRAYVKGHLEVFLFIPYYKYDSLQIPFSRAAVGFQDDTLTLGAEGAPCALELLCALFKGYGMARGCTAKQLQHISHKKLMPDGSLVLYHPRPSMATCCCFFFVAVAMSAVVVGCYYPSTSSTVEAWGTMLFWGDYMDIRHALNVLLHTFC